MNQKQNQEAIDSAAVQFIAGWNQGRIGSQPGRYSATVRLSTVIESGDRPGVHVLAIPRSSDGQLSRRKAEWSIDSGH
jgi:hypothetical protein